MRKTSKHPSAAGPCGPHCWENWRAHRAEKAVLTTVETSLFSDAWFTGDDVTHGPYTIINALPYFSRVGGQFEWKPGLVLRMQHRVKPPGGDLTKTEDYSYHGGWIQDEIAALLSLVLGARIVAGPVERTFGMFGDTDHMGRPTGHSASVLPALPQRTDHPVIPALFGFRQMEQAALVGSFPDLSPEAATSLVKSARSYQQALWICDTTPETSWLLLVSAVETAAQHWRSAKGTPVEDLTKSMPKLVKLLRERGDEGLVQDAATLLAHLSGSTARFLDFMTRFGTEPPTERPEHGRIDFEASWLRRSLAIVYGHRSRALHGGTPFPYPMCQPPYPSFDASGIPSEKPFGLSTGTRGATWLAKDTPMHLHVFAHIVRSALLSWWRTMTDKIIEPTTYP